MLIYILEVPPQRSGGTVLNRESLAIANIHPACERRYFSRLLTSDRTTDDYIWLVIPVLIPIAQTYSNEKTIPSRCLRIDLPCSLCIRKKPANHHKRIEHGPHFRLYQ